MTYVIKARSSATELSILRSLHSRVALVENEFKRFVNLSKGLEGEDQFIHLIESLQSDTYLLHDICFEHNHSVFQIDTMLISEKEILLFEVKNYEGEFVYDAGTFRLVSNNQEIINPLHQLNRSIALLRSMLKSSNLSIKGYLAFINPEFTLLQAPVDTPIILPTQLKRFMKRLEQVPSSLSAKHLQLAEGLLKLHLPKSPYVRVPHYAYEELKKGILCSSCFTFMEQKDSRFMSCKNCGLSEVVDDSILRSIEELRLLFPDRMITTRQVWDWCGSDVSIKTIRRVLGQNYTPKGLRRHRYFVHKILIDSTTN
ncbi:nuclease-related domain-containing protein [Sporosarcina sp. OR05]|uniref:nuclease-related domain-containing protein n=1 Tax=Sporosarcina sp. OR05 TaxID=2969819 RepID=UPI00352A324B